MNNLYKCHGEQCELELHFEGTELGSCTEGHPIYVNVIVFGYINWELF